MQTLLPIISDMVSETNLQVKTALAGVMMALAPLLGKDNTVNHLLPLLLIQLRDENPDVSFRWIILSAVYAYFVKIRTLTR